MSDPSTAFRPIEESSASKLEELMENCRGMELSYNFEAMHSAYNFWYRAAYADFG